MKGLQSILTTSEKLLDTVSVPKKSKNWSVFMASANVSSALSKSSVSSALSKSSKEDNEIEELFKKQDNAKRLITQLIETSNRELEEANQKLDQYNSIYINYIEVRSIVYSLIEKTQSKNNDIIKVIKGLEEQKRDLENEINSTVQDIKKKTDEYKEKREKAKKYFWVPGYNIYLYVEADSAYQSLQITHEILKAELAVSACQLDDAYQQLFKLEWSAKKAANEIAFFNDNIDELSNYISQCSRAVGQWNELIFYYSNLYDQINDLPKLPEVEESLTETNGVIAKLQKEGNWIDLPDVDRPVGKYDILPLMPSKCSSEFYVKASTSLPPEVAEEFEAIKESIKKREEQRLKSEFLEPMLMSPVSNIRVDPELSAILSRAKYIRTLELDTYFYRSVFIILPIINTKKLAKFSIPGLSSNRDPLYIIFNFSGENLIQKDGRPEFCEIDDIQQTCFWHISKNSNGTYTIHTMNMTTKTDKTAKSYAWDIKDASSKNDPVWLYPKNNVETQMFYLKSC